MNALHPPCVAQETGTQEARAPDPWPDAAGTLRLLRRLSGGYGAVLLLLGVLWATPLGAEARSSGLAGIVAGAVLLALAGLLGTLLMAWARSRIGWAVPLPRRQGRLDAAERLARMARRPQGTVVPVLGALAAYAVWQFWPGAPGPLPHAALLGGGAVVLGFPLLVMERIVAGVPRACLPEAPALEALLFVPVAAVPLAGLLHILAGAGAAERVSEARSRSAGIVAIEAGMTPASRPAILDQLHRDRLATLLRKVGRLTAVDPGGARVILPATAPGGVPRGARVGRPGGGRRRPARRRAGGRFRLAQPAASQPARRDRPADRGGAGRRLPGPPAT